MNKKIIMMIITIMMLISLFIINPVTADGKTRDGDFTFDFEDEIVGDNNVSDGNFHIIGTDTAETDNSPVYAGSRSWKCGTAGDSSSTNISFTASHPEVFWYQDFYAGAFTTYAKLYNDDNTEILRIRFDQSAHNLLVYDHELASHVINNDLDTSVWDFFRVSMNATDEVYYQFYDNNDGWFNATYTPYNITSNYNISYIRFTKSTSSNSYNIDNIGYNDVPEAQEDYFDFGDTLSICANPLNQYASISDHKYIEHQTESPFSGTITHILLPISAEQYGLVSMDASDYICKLNDYSVGSADYIQPYGGEYAVVWAGINAGSGYIVNSEQIVFSFGCNQYSEWPYHDFYWYGVGFAFAGLGQTRSHDANSLYNDGILSGTRDEVGNMKLSVCWYYDNGDISQAEPIPNIELIDLYTDSYAENGSMGWLEFYNWFQDCFHRVGDNPYMIYNLTGNVSGGLKTYRVNLVKTGDAGDFVYTTLISIAGAYKTAYYQLPDYTFLETGQYYWQIYNTTDFGLTFGDLVYTSRNIYVCIELGSGDIDTDIFPRLGETMGIIVGLIVTMFCLLSPFIIAGSISKKVGGNIQVPTFVYAVSGGLGIGISTFLGWFPSWLIFFIIACGIIALVGGFVWGKHQQGVV